MSEQIPPQIPPMLRPYWKYWNIGRENYFQTPHTLDTARLRPWSHSKRDEDLEVLRTALNPHRGGRYVPAGRYVKLELFSEARAQSDFGDGWAVFMSDTPDEMKDHADPIQNARGRVLIHGLGLGCILNCLLHKGSVSHIDVVEINEDVINLVAPYYEAVAALSNVSLVIHHGDCATYKWPRNTRWSYVWHDIWSTIADDNLTDDGKAEHGISYATLHRKFASRSDEQASWGWDLARKMRDRNRVADRYVSAWLFEYNSLASTAQRLDMLIEATRSPITPADVWREFLNREKSQLELFRERSQSKMSKSEAELLLHDESMRYAMRKVR
jgi:hypothetical protein